MTRRKSASIILSDAYFIVCINYKLALLAVCACPGLGLAILWWINTFLPSGKQWERQQLLLSEYHYLFLLQWRGAYMWSCLFECVFNLFSFFLTYYRLSEVCRCVTPREFQESILLQGQTTPHLHLKHN